MVHSKISKLVIHGNCKNVIQSLDSSNSYIVNCIHHPETFGVLATMESKVHYFIHKC